MGNFAQIEKRIAGGRASFFPRGTSFPWEHPKLSFHLVHGEEPPKLGGLAHAFTTHTAGALPFSRSVLEGGAFS
jgi:hypothetical protein